MVNKKFVSPFTQKLSVRDFLERQTANLVQFSSEKKIYIFASTILRGRYAGKWNECLQGCKMGIKFSFSIN